MRDLFHGAYVSPQVKDLKIKTQSHVSYVIEKNWYYRNGKIIEQSEIDALYPNTNAVISVRKEQVPKFVFKSPKDHTAIDGRAFALSDENDDTYDMFEFFVQLKQKKEIKEQIQRTNPSPGEWAETMEKIIQNLSIKKIMPIKVFFTSANLDKKECKRIVEQEKNMIILDRSGLKKFLSPQMYYGFGNDE
jgi:hypothetical protein